MASNEQQHNVVMMVQPINVVKDPDILNRLEKAFMDQIKQEVKRGMENKQDEEHTLPVPTVPMTQTKAIENDNVDETSRKAQGKRGRKRTTKLLFEIPFSFEQPRFCLEENINLDKVIVVN
ncbi:hypothetical protein Fmac_011290 [Flemingia macrophylla]|uniref:Uncharacterized protein n=1 Tax=Flemingia macrophylla TaxID=520843 RepID=A0ABD1MM40_9FABA